MTTLVNTATCPSSPKIPNPLPLFCFFHGIYQFLKYQTIYLVIMCLVYLLFLTLYKPLDGKNFSLVTVVSQVPIPCFAHDDAYLLNEFIVLIGESQRHVILYQENPRNTAEFLNSRTSVNRKYLRLRWESCLKSYVNSYWIPGSPPTPRKRQWIYSLERVLRYSKGQGMISELSCKIFSLNWRFQILFCYLTPRTLAFGLMDRVGEITKFLSGGTAKSKRKYLPVQ